MSIGLSRHAIKRTNAPVISGSEGPTKIARCVRVEAGQRIDDASSKTRLGSIAKTRQR